MRGKENKMKKYDLESRITPAYAGKRLNNEKISNRERDHPRLCGEKYEPGIEKSLNLGSPPPMRGKGQTRPLHRSVLGITPAYAGKRASSRDKVMSS